MAGLAVCGGKTYQGLVVVVVADGYFGGGGIGDGRIREIN